jgi:site-specific DNA-methyltransferase (adenine-specific)
MSQTHICQLVELNSIIVPEFRQRKIFDEKKIGELVDSIMRLGLMQAIVLRPDRKTLVAGHRRLLAVQKLRDLSFECDSQDALDHYKHNGEVVPITHIPFVTTDEIDPIALKRMELEENIIREDLTWQEKAQAIKEIHELELSLNPKHTQRDTAAIISKAAEDSEPHGRVRNRVRDSLLLAAHLDDPDVQKAPTQKEALKIITRKLEREFQNKLAETLGPSAKANFHELHQGDCIKLLSEMPPEQFDCVVTDPPYGIGADDFGTQSIAGHKYDDSFEAWLRLQEQLAPLLYKVMKPDSHLYMFCDITNFFQVYGIFEAAGFDVWRTPLIWNKHPLGMLPEPDFGPRRCYEAILYARKGNRRVNSVQSDVLTYAPVAQKEHAAQKPVDLYVDLLKRSALPGEKILDPFAGSGVIFPAADRLQLKATGIELDPASYALAASKIRGLK